jgi:hypothetical protein
MIFRYQENKVKNMNTNQENHAFSIELNHKGNLKTLALSDSADNKTVIEGFLGEIIRLRIVEKAMLEIQGANGAFRIDLEPQDINKIQDAVAKVGKQ